MSEAESVVNLIRAIVDLLNGRFAPNILTGKHRYYVRKFLPCQIKNELRLFLFQPLPGAVGVLDHGAVQLSGQVGPDGGQILPAQGLLLRLLLRGEALLGP